MMKPQWWAERAKTSDTPGRPSPGMVRLIQGLMAPVLRVAHRPTLEGTEHLPTTGAFLLVANHSAGLALAEVMAFAALYLEKVGAERPLAGFAHPFAFHVWPLSSILRGLGAIPSSYASAETALRDGTPILVFPGGDHEALRPVWQANRVDFNGRKGFLRLARKARIPIVPMGIRGSHYTAPILWRSRLLPWLCVTPVLGGAKRWALTAFGVLIAAILLRWLPVSLPFRILATWAWLSNPLVFWPIVPATIRMRIGRPLPPEELFGDEGGDDVLAPALARVEGEVTSLVQSR